mgnify:CR=1 FL=1
MSNILLCVDDSVTMQTVAEITFRKSDWEYVGARNGDDAKSEASAKSPSVILVDAVLSNESGYDLARDLKAANPGAVVIMMCGNSEAYDEAKGAASGCDGHVVKPWQTDKVVEQIAEIANAGPSAAAPAPVAAAPSAPTPKPVAPPKPAVDAGPPRSASGCCRNQTGHEDAGTAKACHSSSQNAAASNANCKACRRRTRTGTSATCRRSRRTCAGRTSSIEPRANDQGATRQAHPARPCKPSRSDGKERGSIGRHEF